MGQLAPTTFSVGADESLAAVDVYAQAGTDILNSYKASVLSNSAALDMFIPQATPLDVLSGQLAAIKVSANGATKIDPSGLMKTLVSANPSLMGALKSLSPALQGNLSVGGLQNSIMASINGIASVVRNADLGTVQGIAKMVTGLAGASIPLAFKDLSGLSTIGVNLVKQAATQGLSGVFSAFASSPAFGGPILNSMAVSLVPMLLKKSNNKLLNEIANSAAAPYVKMYNPSFVQTYLKNWKQEARQLVRNVRAVPGMLKKQRETLKKEWALMIAAFKQIDPKWNKKTSSSGVVKQNAQPVVTASAPAQAALAAASQTAAIEPPKTVTPGQKINTNSSKKATETAFLNLAVITAKAAKTVRVKKVTPNAAQAAKLVTV